MAAIQRQRVEFTGFRGGPGISTFYFQDAAAHQAALRVLLEFMAQVMPTVVNMRIQTTGDIVESTTDQITGTWVGTAQAGVIGGIAGTYSGASGMILGWTTESFLSGRRLRGRNFFVPAAALAYDSDGSIADAHVANGVTPIANFLNAVPNNFLVHQRPRAATNAWTDVQGRTHPAVAARAGGFGTVSSGIVVDKAVTLRSRRD